MKKIKLFLSAAIMLAGLLSYPGCNQWEGRFYLLNAAAATYYYTATDQSHFGIGVEITNEELKGVGGVFAEWEFEILAGDDLILYITRQNYNNFDFRITLLYSTPIPDTYIALSGLLNVVSGRGIDDWKVAGDIFNGKTPDKLRYRVLIEDDNGNRILFEGEVGIDHIVN